MAEATLPMAKMRRGEHRVSVGSDLLKTADQMSRKPRATPERRKRENESSRKTTLSGRSPMRGSKPGQFERQPRIAEIGARIAIAIRPMQMPRRVPLERIGFRVLIVWEIR
jgi:hypothetical protein